MTFLVADRIQETTNSPGTGTATLLGAVSGYQSFSTGIGANNTTFYVIADQLGTNWEVGLGALNSTGTVLTRTTVYSSSNGGSTVNFATGTQYVWCDFPASKSVLQGAAVNFSSIGAATAGTGAFTTLSATSTVSGAGFSSYFAAPPTIGNTTPNAGTFTALVATSITDSGLTAGRVNYNGVGGLLQDSANMTFDGTNLTVLGSISTTISSKTAQFNAAGGSIYSSYADGTKTWRVGSGIQSAGLFSIYNATDSVTAVNIDSSGNLLVGTTSANGYKANIAGNVYSNVSAASGQNIVLSSPNLNTLKTAGSYTCTAATNAPSTYDGSAWLLLEIFTNGSDQIWQRYTSAVYLTPHIYIRGSANSGSTWTSWTQVL